ncbi:hypothetical protein [Flavobacterium sp.]|jgi:hypothetical protein
MKTTSKTTTKTAEKDNTKKMSKTWLAMLKNKDAGNKIIDMRAVLK